MSPAPLLGSWWTDHLQLPGYDPISTAGPARFDPRAAEQALGFFTQFLPPPCPAGRRPSSSTSGAGARRMAGGGMPRSTSSPTARTPWPSGAPP